jgi:siderophore synthetase component
VAESLPQLIDRALAGYAVLAESAEQVDDEWQYVTDLAAAWRARLATVAAAHAGGAASESVVAAVDRALQEIEQITDPHRAVDWLSTFPQVVLLALGDEDRAPPVGPTTASAARPEPAR